ncbi:MAG TPA: NUDIX domain-containing protein [Candidatus Saccharimonadales bacterium]|nr:NUDIX domain-containing protein [Candidatus Saccharimonadales bacterium]
MAINNAPDIHEQVICANIFIRKADKYLVLRRSPLKKYAPGVVHPVGGKVDIGENPYEAAVREVQEEAGVSVANVRLEAVILEIKPVKDEPYNWLIFHFSADYESGDVATTEEGELIWLTSDQLRGEQLFPSVKLVIDHILNHEKGTVFTTIEYDSEKQNIAKHSLAFCVVG